MGNFISEMRRSQNLTQKELAAKLEITDKAISKWERGISCPDISLLIPLARIRCDNKRTAEWGEMRRARKIKRCFSGRNPAVF